MKIKASHIYLYRYIAKFTKMTEYEAGTFRCKDCGKEFLTRRDAEKHYHENHANEVTRAIE
jgi:hypothetical protein